LDKVMIFGVYEFVGFHFCNRFLEKGCIVKGVRVMNGSSHQLLEDKKLAVGRNANFEELKMDDLENLSIDDQPAMIFSLYDFYMTYKESEWDHSAILEKLAAFVKKRQEPMIYLLPIQMLLDTNETGWYSELKEFISQLKEGSAMRQFFYLPAIFGPWQPPSFLFQQSMLPVQKEDAEQYKTTEWVWDTIYIEDAIETMMDVIQKGESGSYLMESGMKDSWGLCADLLKIDRSFRKESGTLSIADEITKVQVIKTTPYSEGLARQREHLSRMIDIDHFL
jgi:hypothetical protein